MRALIVYESMYGNSHAIGEAIARGIGPAGEVTVVGTDAATSDLLIVGGPTHVHGMTRPTTRETARERADVPDSDLEMDPAADGVGLREWLRALPRVHGKRAAAFDTRVAGPSWITGRASTAIGSLLRRRGYRVVASESFIVERPARLIQGETERAETWGAGLAAVFAAVA